MLMLPLQCRAIRLGRNFYFHVQYHDPQHDKVQSRIFKDITTFHRKKELIRNVDTGEVT